MVSAYKVLSKYYDHQVKLRDYLARLGLEIGDDRDDDFLSFLSKVVVVGNCVTSLHPTSLDPRTYSSIGEVILRVIECQCKHGKESENVISLGYTGLKKEDSALGNQCQIDGQNSLIPYLHNRSWHELLKICGDDIMFHLFAKVSMFLSISNGCLIQISGKPLHTVDLKVKVDSFQSNAATNTRSEEVLEREWMFYSPCKKEGIPSSNIMCQIKSSMKSALDLIMEIFGIKSGKKIPKNLINVRHIIQKMIKNHKSMRFKFLLKYYCGNNYDVKVKEEGDSRSVNACEVSSVIRMATESFIPTRKVFLFLRSVLTKVVPKEIWGSKPNKDAFLRNLLKFLYLGRQERFTISQLMNGFKISHSEWLVTQGGKRAHLTRSQSLWIEKTTRTFFAWLMNSYVIPLLRGCFYITETEGAKKKVFYYSKRVWAYIERHGITTLQGTFERISSDALDVLEQTKDCLGVCKLRFVPKGNKVRPVVNMARKNKILEDVKEKEISDWRSKEKEREAKYKQLSINQKLHSFYRCLKYEMHRSPALLGSTVSNFDDVYKRWCIFKRKTVETTEDRKLFYIVSDIKSCFDTMNQALLKDIIERFLKEPVYIFDRFVTLHSFGDKVRKNFRNYVRPAVHDTGIVDFFERFVNLPSTRLKNAVIVDQVFKVAQTPSYLLDLLRKHVYFNVVKLGNMNFRQTKGIPQGSVLSPLLCNIYLGHLEREYFKELLDSDDTLLLRWMDDFLMLTYSEEHAKHFVSTLLSGIPEYGCYPSVHKVITNVPTEWHPLLSCCQARTNQWIPWCGLLFNPTSLEVRANYERYVGKHISESITANFTKHPGLTIKFSLVRICLSKCNSMLLDSDINSQLTIYINMFQCFIFTAKAYHGLVSQLNKRQQPDKNPRFFFSIIINAADKFYRFYQRRCIRAESLIAVSRGMCIALCIKAFIECLKRKQKRYTYLLKRLVSFWKRRCRVLKRCKPLLLQLEEVAGDMKYILY